MTDAIDAQKFVNLCRALTQSDDPDQMVTIGVGHGITTPLWKLFVPEALKIRELPQPPTAPKEWKPT